MTAFLKIDNCETCRRAIPWEWVPTALVRGKALAGTGVWRSQLADGRCPRCAKALEARRWDEQRASLMRRRLLQLLGGEKPYREFTFERYQVAPGNRLAYERCKHFNPTTENLFLWGSCGVGKTHLAYACARRCFEETLSVEILPASQLSRKVRMKNPDHEQGAIDQFVSVNVLLLDDLGNSPDTAFGRQILQEILDGRSFKDQAGLVITSKYSLSAFAEKLGDDTIPSRLAGMCSIIEIRGADGRLTIQTEGA